MKFRDFIRILEAHGFVLVGNVAVIASTRVR